MKPEQLIRLECLKLAAAHAAGPNDTIQRATAYANYVQGGDKAPAPPPAQGQNAGQGPAPAHRR